MDNASAFPYPLDGRARLIVERRGMVDMRKRFRGNAPIGTSRKFDGGGKTSQLYAGKSMYPDTPVGGGEDQAGNKEGGK